MKVLYVFALLSLAASPALAQDCTYLEQAPVQQDGRLQFRFTDSCGQPYEVGYRLEGNTLHFPRGGKHTLPKGNEAEAEKVLRETFGLIGERDQMIRTKGF
jgi:hypothetical protein